MGENYLVSLFWWLHGIFKLKNMLFKESAYFCDKQLYKY